MPALEPIWRSWEPLRPARRSSAMVQAGNFILQRAHALPVQIADRPWALTLSQPPSGRTDGAHPLADAATGPAWCLELLWGNTPFQLQLPLQAAQAWLADAFPERDLPALPEPFAAALLEAVTRAVLAPLTEAGQGELRLVRIERAGPATQGKEERWHLQLKSEAERPDGTTPSASIEGWLSTNQKGVMHLANSLRDWSSAAGPLLPVHVPLVLRAEVGYSWMTAAEWAALRPGDAILVERPLLAPDGELWLTCGPLGLQVRPEAGKLLLTATWQDGGWDVDRDEDDYLESEPLDDLRLVPLRVAFDVGELRMTVAEVEALQVGQALDLGRPLSEAVQVRINGVRVGLGELVDIDGRMGVVLRSLGRTDLADLPWSRSEEPQPVEAEDPEALVHEGRESLEKAHHDLPDLPDMPPPEA